MAIPAARLISRASHIVPGKLVITEYFFSVPLDYSLAPSIPPQHLRIFARSVQKLDPTIVSSTPSKTTPEAGAGKTDVEGGRKVEVQGKQLPWLVYVPGGPGFGARMPQEYGITGFLVERGYQVLFFDHRGMGLSTAVTAETLKSHAGSRITDKAAYLRHFRADSAVKDLEAVRQCLTADYPEHLKKWSVMGQSYGGFVAVSYLSMFPQGLREVFTMGGLPPVTVREPDEVYRRMYRKVEERNGKYYGKFLEDGEKVRRICAYLDNERVELPAGGSLTTERFLGLGMLAFGAHGGLDVVHDIVLTATNDLEIFGFLTRPTLSKIEAQGPFDDHVIYAVLHEPCYCQGKVASNWSAERMIKEYPTFSTKSTDGHLLFRGEMVYKHDFQDYPELKLLEDIAEQLFDTNDWPDLYDIAQLRRNEVPVYSSVYIDDMYVDFDFSRETASLIKGCKTFVTNAMYHDAPRAKSEELMTALFALKEDSID